MMKTDTGEKANGPQTPNSLVPEHQRRGPGVRRKKAFGDIMAENFLNLVKDIKLQIQDAQQI